MTMQNSNEGELKMGRLVLGQGAMAPRARGALSSRSAAPPSARATSPRKDEPPRPMSAAARAMDALQKKIVVSGSALRTSAGGAAWL